MKKFMFSALALVAFSFAGMANELEEDVLIRREFSDCEVLAQVMTDVADETHTNDTGNQWDDWTLNYIYSTHLSECENRN
jgi:hypothetical protein